MIVHESTTVTYTVQAKQRETSYYSTGRVCILKDTPLYLELDDGYPVWSTIMPMFGDFDNAEAATEAAEGADGSPWYALPDLENLTILKYTETHKIEETTHA